MKRSVQQEGEWLSMNPSQGKKTDIVAVWSDYQETNAPVKFCNRRGHISRCLHSDSEVLHFRITLFEVVYFPHTERKSKKNLLALVLFKELWQTKGNWIEWDNWALWTNFQGLREALQSSKEQRGTPVKSAGKQCPGLGPSQVTVLQREDL